MLIAIAATVIVVGAGCGVYLMMGGEEAKESILSITEPGTYENGTYSKVIISAAVGNEDVLLKNIKILKSLIIRGGGSHSVTLEGCTNDGTTTVEKEGGEDVRINLVNTTLSNVQVTSNVILEADADSGFSNVNLDGANATVQGNETNIDKVTMGNDTKLEVNEGNVKDVDVPAQTNATVQTAADGNIQNANVAGNLTVDGSETTVGNVNMQNDSALDVQNGTVSNVNIPSGSNVEIGKASDGTITAATVGDDVSIAPTEGTDLGAVNFEMADDATQGSVTIGDSEQHVHKLEPIGADWNTFDKESMTVSVILRCTIDDCPDGQEFTVTKTYDVSREVIEEATCTEDGRACYFTSIPGDNGLPETIPALGHDLIHHEAKEMTCDEDGWNEYDTCSRCDYSTKVVIPKEHDLTQHPAKAPTCTEVGWEAYEDCSKCDYTTYQEIPALGHNYGTHTVLWDTHDVDANTVEVKDECTRCDESEEGHSRVWTATVQKEVTDPTCTAPGRIRYYVPNTGDNDRSETLDALGHHLIHHDAKAPTCTDSGWNEYDTCSRCDYSTFNEIPATSHQWVDVPAKEPTMEEEGWTAHRECSVCHETEGKQTIPPLAGFTVTVYGGKVAKVGQPLETSVIRVGYGTEVHVEFDGDDCAYWTSNRSDYAAGNSFNALVYCDLYFTPHPAQDKQYGSWVKTDATCDTDGLWYRESTDGQWKEWITIPAHGHHLVGDLTVTQQPTCDSEGSGYRVCDICQEQVTESIPATEHHYVQGNIVSQPVGTAPGKITQVCTECHKEKLVDYYMPVYPEIQDGYTVYLKWATTNDSMNSSVHREETHTVWTIDDNGTSRQAYLYGVKRYYDSGSYTNSERDVAAWLLWVDYGQHSPVYIARVNQATDAAYDTWGVAGYVDSKTGFIDFIDGMHLGTDNGSSASQLYSLYRSWTEQLNNGMSGLYETGDSFVFRGKNVTPYFNDDGAFWVDENNCCLYRAFGSGYYASILQVKSIGQETHLPFEHDYVPIFYKDVSLKSAVARFFNNIPTLSSVSYHHVELLNGDYGSGDRAAPGKEFFDIESLDYAFTLATPYSWISSRNLEVQGLDGTWYPVETGDYTFDGKSYRGLKLDGLVTVPHYDYNTLGYLYEYMVQCHSDNFVMPGAPEFKGIFLRFADENYPASNITVANGTLEDYSDDGNGVYRIDGNTTIYLSPDEIYGKRFDYWEVTVDGVKTQLEDNHYQVVPGKTIAIAAVYRELAEYHITLSAGPGGLVNTSSITCLEEGEFSALAIPEPGYVFSGWWDVTNEYTYNFNRELRGHAYGDMSLMARFEPVDFEADNPYMMTNVTITNGFLQVDDNGTPLTSVYVSEPKGQRVYILENPRLDEIYRWDCAYSAELANPTKYTMSPDYAEEDGRINVKYAGKLTTVVGVFTADLSFYELTYDLNGAEGNVEGGTYANDEEVYLSGAPEREGYDFNGWNTQADGNGTPYEAQQRIFLDGNLVLYAQWSPKTSTVTVSMPYAINYQFYNITQQKINVICGQPALIPAGIVTDLKGFTITGWSYNYNAELVTVAADGTGTVPYGVTSIVAVCSYVTYTLHFDKNNANATGSMDDRTFTVKDLSSGQYLSLRTPFGYTLAGYDIREWKYGGTTVSDNDGTRLLLKSFVLDSPAEAQTFELDAQWTEITHTLYYKNNFQYAGFTSVYPLNFSISETAYLMTQSNVIFGSATYYLIGWTVNSDGTGIMFKGATPGSELVPYCTDCKINVYAQWAVKAYTVEFYDDFESQASVATQNLQYGAGPTALISVDSMVKEGCTFVGWDTDPSANNVVYHDGDTVSDLVTDGSAFKLYAVWIHSSYTVHFDKNAEDATGEMSDQTFNANEAKGLTPNAFAREGYEFDRWCTTEYNQGEFFDDGQTVKNLTTEESITLYAIWKQAPGS